MGYDEALLLDTDGFVAEGAGENLFIIKNNKIYEPELTSALIGITRETVIKLLMILVTQFIVKKSQEMTFTYVTKLFLLELLLRLPQ